MPSLKFESILIVSHREQRARHVEFVAGKNLIVGRNHTGKSSLIKAIFTALGARPEGKLDKWDKEAVIILTFSVDGTRYRLLNQGVLRAVFSDRGETLYVAGSTSEWGQYFSAITGFNLVLTDKEGRSTSADARAFFLPFYINQDGSWQSQWATFVGLQQYKAPIKPILEYFTGVRPAKYYELSSLKRIADDQLRAVERERSVVIQVRERLSKSVSLTGPKTIPVVFERDVTLLVEEVTSLNAKQESLRDTQVRELELIDSLKLQVRMAEDAIAAHDGDANYLQAEPQEPLVCPTCGAEHQKTFLDVLSFTEDARVLKELVVKLQMDVIQATSAAEKTKNKLRELDNHYARVSAVLDARRGDLMLGDVVKSMGAEVAFEAFEDELSALKKRIDELEAGIAKLVAELNSLTSRERTIEIMTAFRRSYASARFDLNVPAIDTSKTQLASRPGTSGSGGPRSVLAYYSALWSTALGPFGTFAAPLVIDSPQQQGQDEENFPRMIRYVAEDLPEGAQSILGVEATLDYQFDSVIVLDHPYELLRVEDYAAAVEISEPLMTAMFDVLRGQAPG